MTCKEAESLAIPYTHEKLSEREMEGFPGRIETYKNCKEELEIYYTVDVDIRQLDTNTGTYNIKEATEEDIITSKQQLHTLRIFDICRYVFGISMVIYMLVILVLQMCIWWQTGIF